MSTLHSLLINQKINYYFSRPLDKAQTANRQPKKGPWTADALVLNMSRNPYDGEYEIWDIRGADPTGKTCCANMAGPTWLVILTGRLDCDGTTTHRYGHRSLCTDITQPLGRTDQFCLTGT